MPLSKLTCFLVLCAIAFGQETPKFEVATIKPAPSNVRGNQAMPNGPGRILLRMNLYGLIYWAYGSGMSTEVHVTGGPEWANKTIYDIQGQAQGNPKEREFRLMLRSLLEERFALKVRTEIQSIDVFGLFPVRIDGKLGPKVQEWDGKCTGREPIDDDDPTMPRCLSGMRAPGLVLEGATMFNVAELLSLPLPRAASGRMVEDRTGLTGRYNMVLDFQFPLVRPNDGTAPVEPTGPSIFTALREQWGLKLEPVKGSLKVIAIESAQPPTEN